MKGNKRIFESLKEETQKQDEEKTTFQIRIYDDKTGIPAYKYLTRKELVELIKLLDGDLEWSVYK